MNEEGYAIIEVCPEGYIGGPSLDILLNWRDIRSKFGYIALCEIHSASIRLKNGLTLKL